MYPETSLLISSDTENQHYNSIIEPEHKTEKDIKPKKSKLRQILLCCLASSSMLGSGMCSGFTAIALPYMMLPDSSLSLNEDQASWVASLTSIANPVGCLVSGHLLDSFGRRATLLLISIPLVIGWLLIGLDPSLYQLYLGRICSGIGVGLGSIPASVFNTEVADISNRGFLLIGNSLNVSTGVVIVYILGALLKSNWQLVAFICAAFPAVSGVMMFFLLPESPLWLVSKNRNKDASKALMYINRTSNPSQVEEELQLLADRVEENQKQSSSLRMTLKALTSPEAYKPFIIMNTFFFFQQVTGTSVILSYSVDMVMEAGVNVDPFLVTVLNGFTCLVFTFLSAYMSKTIGRCPTSVISGVGMTISLLILATHILLQQEPHSQALLTNNNTDLYNTSADGAMLEANEPIAYLPLSMLLLYTLSSTIGFITLPWSMISEVFPSQIRGIASGLTSCTAYIMSFVILKMYPFMKEVLDKHGIFYFFGTMAFFGTLFVFFFLPETEGKTLREIELHFSKRGGKKSVDGNEKEALKKTKMPQS